MPASKGRYRLEAWEDAVSPHRGWESTAEGAVIPLGMKQPVQWQKDVEKLF